mmetsp:Transcript_3100/g.4566  ORF Transcript_3100/g.4566 Transcript_3100/m.4566 type:complete len:925 (-) Transcript_3100:846-3620(-)
MFARILGYMANALSGFREPELTGKLYLPSKIDSRGNTVEYLHQQGIEIRRDKHGVPHIDAKSEYDGIFAQGFLQAQERLFQLELLRRIAKGCLSEIIPEAEEVDKISKTFGFYRMGVDDVELAKESELAQHSVENIQSFVEGINGFLSECYSYSKPVEMTLYSMEKPEPFDVYDIASIARLMAYQNSHSWVVKLIHSIAQNALRLTSMNSNQEENLEGEIENPFEDEPDKLRLFFQLNWEQISEWLAQAPSVDLSSSAFVIPGKYTNSGKPIFAIDMHDDLTAPSRYMQMSVNVVDKHSKVKYYVNGIAIVGLPYIVCGFNDHLAFGPTRGNRDVNDLFIETIDTSDNSRYEYKKRWYYSKTIDEHIKVKGKKDMVHERVRITNHGPILHGFLKKQHLSRHVREIALSATYLKPLPKDLHMLPLEAFYLMNRAQNIDDIHVALNELLLFQFVYTYAHINGSYGLVECGRVPKREKRDANPVVGSHGEFDWDKDFIQSNSLPAVHYENEDTQPVLIHTATSSLQNEDIEKHVFCYNRRGQDLKEMVREFLSKNEQVTVTDVVDFQHAAQYTYFDKELQVALKLFIDRLADVKESEFVLFKEHQNYNDISFELFLAIVGHLAEGITETRVALDASSSCIMPLWIRVLSTMLLSNLLDKKKEFIHFGTLFDQFGMTDFLINNENRFLIELFTSYSVHNLDLMESIVGIIHRCRAKDHALKKLQPKAEVEAYTIGLLRSPIHFSHFIEHQKVSGFEIQKRGTRLGFTGFDQGFCDMSTLDQLSPISQDLSLKHNYLNFSPNLPNRFRASSFRFVIDMQSNSTARCLHAPGNSGHRHSKFYRHIYDSHYLSGDYVDMEVDMTNDSYPTLYLFNLQTQSILNTSLSPSRDGEDDNIHSDDETLSTTSVGMTSRKRHDVELRPYHDPSQLV